MRKYILFFGLLVSWVFPLSIHVFFIEYLQIPHPSVMMRTELIPYEIGKIFETLGLVVASFCFLQPLRCRFPQRSSYFRCFLLWVLLCTINGTLRSWFMNSYCTEFTIKTIIFMAANACIDPIVYAFLVVFIQTLNTWNKNRVQYFLIVSTITAILVLIVSPLISFGHNILMGKLSALAPTSAWATLPYGMNVFVPAYITFLEQTLAAFVCVAIVFHYSKKTLFIQIISAILLVMALTKQLFTALFFGLFYTDEPFWKATLSMLQFTLESAALGLTTFLTWKFSQRSVQKNNVN